MFPVISLVMLPGPAYGGEACDEESGGVKPPRTHLTHVRRPYARSGSTSVYDVTIGAGGHLRACGLEPKRASASVPCDIPRSTGFQLAMA
jgi:hypothetical protein